MFGLFKKEVKKTYTIKASLPFLSDSEKLTIASYKREYSAADSKYKQRVVLAKVQHFCDDRKLSLADYDRLLDKVCA